MVQDARLIIIPGASHAESSNPLLVPALLPDTHTGPDKRCEDNNDAWTDSHKVKQASELRTPAEAWLAMGKPTIMLNANYFRYFGPQENGKDVEKYPLLGAFRGCTTITAPAAAPKMWR